MHCIFTNKQ